MFKLYCSRLLTKYSHTYFRNLFVGPTEVLMLFRISVSGGFSRRRSTGTDDRNFL
jgi:hypothetical protein